jgi:transcriptional regulator with XRE-family HTH domain
MQPTDLGGTIRAEMGRQRISMLELARRTGVPRTTLAFQIDNHKLSVANLVAIAKALNLNAADLLPAAVA